MGFGRTLGRVLLSGVTGVTDELGQQADEERLMERKRQMESDELMNVLLREGFKQKLAAGQPVDLSGLDSNKNKKDPYNISLLTSKLGVIPGKPIKPVAGRSGGGGGGGGSGGIDAWAKLSEAQRQHLTQQTPESLQVLLGDPKYGQAAQYIYKLKLSSKQLPGYKTREYLDQP